MPEPNGIAIRDLEGFQFSNLETRITPLTKSASTLENYGRFFWRKLYPPQVPTEIEEICDDLNKMFSLINELKPYWEDKVLFNAFLKFLMKGSDAEFSWNFLEAAKEAQARIENEKAGLIGQIRTLRKQVLEKTQQTADYIETFLNTN